MSCITAGPWPSLIDCNPLNPKIQFVAAILAFIGLLAPVGSTCARCDLTNGAASACGKTADSEQKARRNGFRAFDSNSPPPAPANSCERAAGHQHRTPANPASRTWRSDQALSGIQSSCCRRSSFSSPGTQAVATLRNWGTRIYGALSIRIIDTPSVVYAPNKLEAAPPPSTFSDQAFLCVFLV